MANPFADLIPQQPQQQAGPITVGTPRPEKPKDPPPGYRWGASGELVPIPGGPADPALNLPPGYQIGPSGVAERIPGLPAPPAQVKAESRAPKLDALAQQIAEVRRLYSKHLSGKGVKSLIEYLPLAGNQEFDTAAAGLAEMALGAFRTPGVGSQSDAELRAFVEANRPSAADKDEVVQRKLKNIIVRLNAERGATGLDPIPLEQPTLPSGTLERGDAETPVQAPRLKPEDEAAWRAFMRTKPSADQINAFASNLGYGPVINAQEVAEAAQRGGISSEIDYSYADKQYQDRLRAEAEAKGIDGGYSALGRQGVTFGLSDEAAGLGVGLSRLLQGRDPLEGYREGRDTERLQAQDARTETGWAGTAAEVGSSLLTGNVSGAFRSAPTLAARVRQGAKAGAAAGGTAGFGYGEGATNSLLTGAAGATGGAALGGLFPIVGQAASNRWNGLLRLLGRDPALPRRLVGEAIEADGNTPRLVGQMMDDARGRGSPMMLADTGENARALTASVGRQPGPSRTLVRGAINERQNGQAERISEAVVRDLGPTANIRELGDELIDRARKTAAPLYDEFYSSAGASTVRLDDLLSRPSFQQSLKNAYKLAKEEGVDPTSLGFDLDAAGEVVLQRVPSFQTLDYVKRGLDDVIEAYRDKTTGKLALDGQGRATNATLRTLIARMDKAAPVYAQARAAYAGPAKMREALEKGAKSLSRSPDDIQAMMKGMGEAEQESFRLGIRKAITDLIASRRDGGDKVALLLGTPKARAVLTKIFGGRGDFERFVATLRDEAEMGATFRSVSGNSMTAERLAQDSMTNDAGLAETAMDAALKGAQNGLWSAGAAFVQKLRDIDKFGAGQAGQRARESVAALLTETDPAVLRQLVAAARRAQAEQRVKGRSRGRRAVRQGKAAGTLEGLVFGRASEERRAE